MPSGSEGKMLITNKDAREFLAWLDNSDHTVTDWEARFIESNLDRTEFTASQKRVIQDLLNEYGN